MSDQQPALITPELVALDANLGAAKREVITAMAGIVAATGRAESEGLARDAWAREEQGVTGMGNRIAIPHCRSEAVNTATLGFARLAEPIDFGAPDGPADLIFMIAAPEGGNDEHLQILARLAGSLMHEEFLASLREATTAEEVVAIIDGVVADNEQNDGKHAAAVEPDGAQDAGAKKVRIVAFTACPTGIAHTFMAADGLAQAAERRDDVELRVEPQGSAGYEPLADADVKAADAVIIAADIDIRGRERLVGKPGVEAPVKRGVSQPDQLIDEALAALNSPSGHRIKASSGGSGDAEGTSSEGKVGWGKRIQKALMTGVSYMIPFVAAGGLLVALAFLLGGYDITNSAADIVTNNSLANLPEGGLMTYLAALFATVGGMALGFLVPALSAYIAYALAGRPGIAPGFVGGAIALAVGAGFIGGLVTGLFAGFVAMWIGSWKTPRWLAGLMPVVIIPLLTTAATALLMYLLLGRPLAMLMEALTGWLNGLSGGSSILLGAILGLMMCFDLGGPVNKAAYLFATAGLSAGTDAAMMVMSAVMVGGMVPPLALALASAVRPKLFTPEERKNGQAAWLLGAAFISEGAIPFAAADPLRVIPSMMAGGAVAGGLSMAFETTLRAPHGGIFVFFAIDPIWGFLIALVAGTLVAAIAVVLLKQFARRQVEAPAVETREPQLVG
ncbi:PTS fructose transporter subunit IIABC [Gulosibacter molinativorax]|uniref:PTS lactose transporter subunit IIC n=1 Tax=Gulosibacter molinativorax TaxID=256821 RepID=A0ABT7CA01_9MICO|nr:fructose-specific PTS transporter subunit EIIC [Gulosibacter molinativorax]MDJ1371974.1 PTS lactose transporter subunit IIC [Gulosibacter molinativorax]QUY62662.1 PTS fructose-specific enzyme IIABC [Gulosibacter molinativorax]